MISEGQDALLITITIFTFLCLICIIIVGCCLLNKIRNQYLILHLDHTGRLTSVQRNIFHLSVSASSPPPVLNKTITEVQYEDITETTSSPTQETEKRKSVSFAEEEENLIEPTAPFNVESEDQDQTIKQLQITSEVLIRKVAKLELLELRRKQDSK